MTSNEATDVIVIDGKTVEVVARQEARQASTLTDGATVAIPTVHELLLIDDRTVYQCVHPLRGNCMYYNLKCTSVISHQRVHGANAKAKEAKAAQAALAKVAAEKEAEFQRRSAGMNASNALKKARHEAEVTANDPKVRLIQRSLSDLGVALDREARNIDNIRKMLNETREQLKDVTTTTASSDVDVDKLSTEEKFALIKKLMS